MRPVILFVIGPTNAGKSQLMKALQTAFPADVGLVEVGKLLRIKYLDPESPYYDPDKFKGQAAPKETAAEAWRLAVDGIQAQKEAGKVLIAVDGQPRDVEQCIQIYEDYERRSEFSVQYAHVYAPTAVREARADERDKDDPAKLKLSRDRMNGDLIGMYEVLTRLQNYNSIVHILYTDHEVPVEQHVARLVPAIKAGAAMRSFRLGRIPK
jgi:hypothetical protein